MQSAVAIGRAENVGLGRQHHVVEVLSEHSGREECHCPQRFLADVGEVVLYASRKCEDTARTYHVCGAVLHEELAAAGDDVLGLLRRVGMPAESMTGLDLVHDRRRLRRTVASIYCECAGPVDCRVVFAPYFAALEFAGFNDWFHALLLCGRPASAIIGIDLAFERDAE